MLRKNKNLKNDAALEPLAAPEPSAVSVEKTIIGENISIKGSIHGKGNLVIQGSVKGNIDLEKHHLTIGPNGNVEAEINAEHVTISGHLTGNIHARGKVEITRTAEFSGEIKAKRISVEDGAFLKAVIELHRDAQPGSLSKPSGLPSGLPGQEKDKPNLKSASAKGN